MKQHDRSPGGHHVRRAFDRAAETYDAAAGVQQQVAKNLLDIITAADRPASAAAEKGITIDLGCGTGFAFSLLRQAFPASRIIGIDFAEAMLAKAPANRGNLQKIAGNATCLPFADTCADRIFSNMTLQWCPLDNALAEAHRTLRPAGQLAFSTLTGQTFHELKQAFADLDQAPHVLPLLSPQDIEAAVLRAGFSHLTLQRKTHLARFASVSALFGSIRQTGASGVAPTHAPNDGRRQGMLGKAAFARIKARLESLADSAGMLPLTYDVLYVGAQKPEFAA